LTVFEISVGCRNHPARVAKGFSTGIKAQRAAGFPPFKACRSEDPIETLCFGLMFHRR
jgi:hypothetical protein